MGQDGSTLDRYGSDLQENVSRSDPAGRDEPPVPGESKELADDDRLRDRLGHLRVAADQSGADTRKAVLHAREDLSDPRLGGSEWKQDDGQEPPWPDAHDRNVVRVHDDRETTDLLRRQGYRVRRSDEHATGDLDGARILPDARSEEDARWWGRKLRQQLAQKGDGKLSGLKGRWRARMDVHGGRVEVIPRSGPAPSGSRGPSRANGVVRPQIRRLGFSSVTPPWVLRTPIVLIPQEPTS
jgi:hypothetical protein